MSKIKLPPYLGAKPDDPDEEDLIYEEHIAGAVIKVPTFAESFSNQQKYGKLIEDNQGSSYACVAEMSSNDTEMSCLIASGKRVHLDVRDLYYKINLPGGGASIRDAYKFLQKEGISETRFNPRPEKMTERLARQRGPITNERLENAKKYKIGKYFNIKSLNPEIIAHGIFTNGGVGGGFLVGGNMGHAVYLEGYGLREWRGLKLHAIKYFDSYKPFEKWIVWYKNRIYLDSPSGSQIKLFSHWTAEPNPSWIPIMAKIFRKKRRQEVIVVIGSGAYWFKDISDFNNMASEIPWIKWENENVVDDFPEEIKKKAIRIIGAPDLRTSVNSQILGKAPEMEGNVNE